MMTEAVLESSDNPLATPEQTRLQERHTASEAISEPLEVTVTYQTSLVQYQQRHNQLQAC